MTVIPVEVVRPKLRGRKLLTMLLGDWLVAVPVSSFVAMLLLGACHSEVDLRVPALGYLQTLLALYTLRFITNFVTPWDVYKLWTSEAS